MIFLAEYTHSIYANVDARKLIEEFPAEWQDFLRDSGIWDSHTELEFVRESAESLGQDFWTGPWISGVDENEETYVR